MLISRRAPAERVLLVHPGIYDDTDPRLFPPWGALLLGAGLLDQGHSVQVLDLNGADLDSAIPQAISAFDPGTVAITCKLGLAARRFRRIVEIVRTETPAATIVAGGPLVGSYPDADHPLWAGVDAVFWGDGEEALPAWFATAHRPAGLIGPSEVADLDRLGIPLWWEPLRGYVKPAAFWPNMDLPGLHVASARGCTRRCTFCYLNSQYPGTRFRYISGGKLFDDLVAASAVTEATGFYFVDDCFIDRPGHRIQEFCERSIAEARGFRYGCDVQLTDLENPDLLATMHAAGFRALYVGIESASNATRKLLAKGSIKTSIRDLVNRTLDMGYTIRASIGIGWPGETAADARRTLDMIDDIPRLAFDAYRFLPLPGTPLGDKRLGPSSRAEDAFDDYSVFNRNHSEIPDTEFEQLWFQMRDREADRFERYFAAHG
jgi:radical SAM superfamily enzyme YgiQ (UPF0313 family)